MALLGSGIYNFWPLINACSVYFLSICLVFMMPFPLYCFGKFQDIQGQIAGPYFIVKGFGADHFLFREELVLAGIADTSIDRPLFFTHLCDDPLNKRRALINAVRLVAILSVFFVHSVPTLCAIAGSTATTARSGWCAAL